MKLLRGPIDYAQRGHLLLRDPGHRGEVFRFLEETLKEMVEQQDARGAGTYLSPVIDLLEGRKSLLVSPDPELQEKAREFFIRNAEVILKLAALARSGRERSSLLYAMVKFLPELAHELPSIYRLTVGGYLVLIHTLARSDEYGEGNCLALAVKGLYRWDGEDIVKTWGRSQEIQNILENLGEEDKKPYPWLKKMAIRLYPKLKKGSPPPYSLAFLLMTTTLLNTMRLALLSDGGRDLLWTLEREHGEEIKEEIENLGTLLFPQESSLIQEVTAFMEGRLKEEIKTFRRGESSLF